MSLFGKMMAILNVLAAGAFLFLAAQDYAARKQWTYAVFKHKLALSGLPVDEEETDDENRPIAANIDDELADAITGDSSTKTLEQFLDLRKAELDELVAKEARENRELAAYLELLLPLADTLQARAQLRSGQLPVTALKDRFQEHVDAVKKIKDRDAKRQAIARLLIAWADVLPGPADRARRAKEYGTVVILRDDPLTNPEVQRLVRVLGSKQIARELSEQAEHASRLATDIENTRSTERMHFVYTYTDLVNSILPWNTVVAEQEQFRLKKKKQADDQEALANAQIAEVKKLTDELADAKKKTGEFFQALTKQQDELHDVRVRLRDADVINQMKESLIRKLEGLPPR